LVHLFRKSKVCKNCKNWYETEDLKEDNLDKLLIASKNVLKDIKNNGVYFDSVKNLEKIIHEFEKS